MSHVWKSGPTYLLHGQAVGALHLCDLEAVHLVVLLGIVAQPAHIQLATARRLGEYTQTQGRRLTSHPHCRRGIVETST